MYVLPPVHFEVLLIKLISNAIPDLASEQHLGTVHEVEHHVLEVRLECVTIYLVKVNFVFGNDLNPNISFLEVDLALLFHGVMKRPLLSLFVLVEHSFEEQNLTRTARNQYFAKNEEHLPEHAISDFFSNNIWCFF